MKKDLASRLEAHPRIKAQVEKMLDMAGSCDGSEIIIGDDAEDFVVDEGKKLEKIFLEEWGETQAKKAALNCEARHKTVRKDIKKN